MQKLHSAKASSSAFRRDRQEKGSFTPASYSRTGESSQCVQPSGRGEWEGMTFVKSHYFTKSKMTVQTKT